MCVLESDVEPEEGHPPPAEGAHPAHFAQVTDMLAGRASLLHQSVLTDGSGITDLEAEGSICNPRVAQAPGGGQSGVCNKVGVTRGFQSHLGAGGGGKGLILLLELKPLIQFNKYFSRDC